jgi:hypothetical protein
MAPSRAPATRRPRQLACLRFALLAGLFFCATRSHATEGNLGRPITGMQITPYAGIVPPTPGLNVSLSSIWYSASQGRSRQTVIGNTIRTGLDLDVSYTLMNAVYVWDTGTREWNFASGVGLPLQYTSASASLNDRRLTDRSTNLADILFIPIVAGYHFSATSHMALGLQVYAPTGSYEKGRLANAGQNVWTFIPNVSYTQLWPEQNIEFSSTAGLQFYSRNTATDYRSGLLGTLDATLIKRFSNGFGFGAVAGWIQQLQDDSGVLADRLDGNKGYAFGVGPIATWQHNFDKSHAINASLRWVSDLDTRNRPKGNAYLFNIAASF